MKVPAGGSVTEHLVGVLNDIPKGQLRVTTLVGFYLGDATEPAIRSADAATIAGVKDPAHAVSDPAPKPSSAGDLRSVVDGSRRRCARGDRRDHRLATASPPGVTRSTRKATTTIASTHSQATRMSNPS